MEGNNVEGFFLFQFPPKSSSGTGSAITSETSGNGPDPRTKFWNGTAGTRKAARKAVATGPGEVDLEGLEVTSNNRVIMTATRFQYAYGIIKRVALEAPEVGVALSKKDCLPTAGGVRRGMEVEGEVKTVWKVATKAFEAKEALQAAAGLMRLRMTRTTEMAVIWREWEGEKGVEEVVG